MKAIKIAIVAILALNVVMAVFNWVSDEPQSDYVEATAAEGLDLKALTVLTKEIRSGQELERRLNEKEGINNLDLNGDEKTDYISVTEFGSVKNKIGYSLVVEPIKDEKQEIATVTVEKNQDRAEIQVIGNDQIYGENAIFNDYTTIERDVSKSQYRSSSALPIVASYFLFRPLWASPWHYGYYPSFYSPYYISGPGRYASNIGRYQSDSVRSGQNAYQKNSTQKINSPNKGKTANKGIARSLTKPTATQKKFRATNKSSIRSGGFGNSGKRSVSSRTSSRSSSLFGGSSFKSSGSSSRSFSSGGK